MSPRFCLLLLGLSCVHAQVVTFSPQTPNIPSVVASSPEGTKFVFLPGVYRNLEIFPRNNQTFSGQPGAILNGSELITNSTRSGSVWVAQNRAQIGFAHGECDAAYPRCIYAQDLFIDDRPLKHVATKAQVAVGTWHFDFANRTVYFGTDPTGRKVELSATRVAFTGAARNVTIEGLVVEKYANEGQYAAIGERNAGPGWIVRNNEVRLNHGVGIALATGAVASNNYVHDNGQLGISSSESGVTPISNIVIESNHIAYNNWAGFSTGWQAGGVKICTTLNSVIRNNDVHDNNGPGLWSDISSSNLIYEGNTVMNNLGAGILHEISFKATIRNNIVGGNRDTGRGWVWGSQILLQNSQSTEAYGNVVEAAAGHGDGIVVISQNRGAQYPAKNNYIHHNTVIYNGVNGTSGVTGDWDMASVLQTNRFDYNSYQVPDMETPHWSWDWMRTRSQFQSAGQEANGRFAVRLTPLLNPRAM
jgi:parallel beta-helix repeat protein